MITCDWTNLKNLYNAKKISPQYVEDASAYYIHLFDGPAAFSCIIKKTDPANADQLEFETSYKAICNGRLVDPMPFANPTYRTKRSKTADLVTIAPGATVNIDFQLTEERYIHGGSIVYDGAELGDYITACVYDKDGVIPVPYRIPLCEAWPVVGEYIPGEWIDPQGSRLEINTYPLNAKITAGLYLRITYYAAGGGLVPRKVGINYFLTKKL